MPSLPVSDLSSVNDSRDRLLIELARTVGMLAQKNISGVEKVELLRAADRLDEKRVELERAIYRHQTARRSALRPTDVSAVLERKVG